VRAFEAAGISDSIALDTKQVQDFVAFDESCDLVIAHPPWAKWRAFLRHSFALATNEVVFLAFLTHLVGTRARLRNMREAGFGVREVCLVETPPTSAGSPQCGLVLAAVHYKKGWAGDVAWGWPPRMVGHGQAGQAQGPG
jgi:hypothetical protein